MNIEKVTLGEWEQLLPDSGFTPFHTPAALFVMNDYSKGELQLLAGFHEQQPLALLPVFVRKEYPLTIIVSPPPGLSVPWLGPVLISQSANQQWHETLNQNFAREVLRVLDADKLRTLFGLVGSPEYTDPRPYSWENLGVNPRFNVVLNLAERNSDDILQSFTRDIRKEIRKDDEIDISIGLGGSDAAKRICDDLKERHAEQGLTYPTPRAYTGDFVEELDDRARVYVARAPNGQFLSGIIVLYSNDDALFWQGGTKANYQGISVNSLLHWRIIDDIINDSELEDIDRYHLGDANNSRLARYKSKFNGELVVNYEIKSTLMTYAKSAYSIRRHITAQTVSDRLSNLYRGR